MGGGSHGTTSGWIKSKMAACCHVGNFKCYICGMGSPINIKGEGKRFLHGDLICRYILSEYISDI